MARDHARGLRAMQTAGARRYFDAGASSSSRSLNHTSTSCPPWTWRASGPLVHLPESFLTAADTVPLTVTVRSPPVASTVMSFHLSGLKNVLTCSGAGWTTHPRPLV